MAFFARFDLYSRIKYNAENLSLLFYVFNIVKDETWITLVYQGVILRIGQLSKLGCYESTAFV